MKYGARADPLDLFLLVSAVIYKPSLISGAVFFGPAEKQFLGMEREASFETGAFKEDVIHGV